MKNKRDLIENKCSKDILGCVEKLGDLYILVDKSKIRDVLKTLKEDESLQYTYFSECLGVDYSTWNHDRDLPGRFEVVYNLMSPVDFQRVFIKTSVDDGEKLPSVKDIFAGAEYPEREIWDLFGIVFEGNEQSERFLMPDDWVGYPLRKEFPLGGENVQFDQGSFGPSISEEQTPHAGESFDGKTGVHKR